MKFVPTRSGVMFAVSEGEIRIECMPDDVTGLPITVSVLPDGPKAHGQPGSIALSIVETDALVTKLQQAIRVAKAHHSA